MLIVSITARRRRAEIVLEDGTQLTFSLDLIAENRLRSGTDLAPAFRQALEIEDARRSAIAAALRLLAAGPRSEQELRQRLRRRSFSPLAITSAVDRVRELG